ncbi:MAG: S41 family peptidase [Bacteroidia bacterium]|nr:S41 family peptidase [Bacteroidia bacterium]
MRLPRRNSRILTGIAAFAGFGLLAAATDNYFEISKNLDIFGKLYREIYTLYVDETEPEALIGTGIDAMLSGLDPYTDFIPASEAEEVRYLSTGEYAGLGLLVGKREGRMLVLEVYQGFAADRAGIRPGDQILEAGTLAVGSETSVEAVRKILRGEPGAAIPVSLLRDGSAVPMKLTLTREVIRQPNVPWYGMIDAQTGYIALTGFAQGASREVIQAIRKLREGNPGLAALVLDLRGNPGGRLDEAVQTANIFLPQGSVIVETRGRLEDANQILRAAQAPAEPVLPLAVLIDGGSASASEIVAGAIQDLDRGVVVGSRSFGKGLVQTIRPLNYEAQLKITTAKYYTPAGRCIQAVQYSGYQSGLPQGALADSLRQPFKTRSGRTVYDGGGISPDVPVADPAASEPVKQLLNRGAFFDFATRYAQTHPQIAAPRAFSLGAADLAAFKAFVAERKLGWQTPADAELAALRRMAEAESYPPSVMARIGELEAASEARKAAALDSLMPAAGALLRKEILRRYYYQQGAVEGGLAQDQTLDAALGLLRDPARYAASLGK